MKTFTKSETRDVFRAAEKAQKQAGVSRETGFALLSPDGKTGDLYAGGKKAPFTVRANIVACCYRRLKGMVVSQG